MTNPSGSGIVAFGLFSFSLGVQLFNVVDHRSDVHQPVEQPELAAPVIAPIPGTIASD